MKKYLFFFESDHFLNEKKFEIVFKNYKQNVENE